MPFIILDNKCKQMAFWLEAPMDQAVYLHIKELTKQISKVCKGNEMKTQRV